MEKKTLLLEGTTIIMDLKMGLVIILAGSSKKGEAKPAQKKAKREWCVDPFIMVFLLKKKIFIQQITLRLRRLTI